MIVTLACVLLAADPTMAESSLSEKTVAAFAPLVGEWNGVAMPRRGSAAGSWKEAANWEFAFDESAQAVAVEMVSDGGDLLESVLIKQNGDNGSLVAVVTRPMSEKALTLPLVKSNDTSWIFGGPGDDMRLSLRKLSEIRTVLLVETAAGKRFRRAAEIGYTRDGEKLATEGATGRVCIVTGGRGTMEVQHDGQTYHVCCSGCRQAFESNPERILAAAKARAEKAGMRD